MISFQESSSYASLLNVDTDIFGVFNWNLLQHMNEIVVNGNDCGQLTVTFDATSFKKGILRCILTRIMTRIFSNFVRDLTLI